MGSIPVPECVSIGDRCEHFSTASVYIFEDTGLERRISRNLSRTRKGEPKGARCRPIVVIADSGVAAEVLIFSPEETFGTGTEFTHRGTTWIITGVSRDSGVLVARPTSN